MKSMLHNIESILALTPEWSELQSRCADPVPFLSPAWLQPWWDIFGPTGGRRPLAFVYRDMGRLIGFAPLVQRTHWYRHGVPFSRLELWGSGEREEDSICTDYLSPLAEQGQEIRVAEAFATNLIGLHWDEFVVPRMAGDSVILGALVEAFGRRGLKTQVTPEGEAPREELASTWEGYLGNLPGRDRYFVRRSLRDFETWTQGAWSWHEATTLQQVQQGAGLLRRLHGERWQGTGQGTFRSGRFLRFHERTMENLLASGQLKLTWLIAQNEPIAALYSVRSRGVEYFYQCGRKLDVPAGIRPGVVQLAMAMQRAIQDGLTTFDFLGGAVQYKRQMARSLRSLVEFRVVRSGWKETAQQGMEWGKQVLRRFARKIEAKNAARA